MSAPIDVSVIIVNWNAGQFLEQCLSSLFEAGNESLFEVIVVDNASTDGSADRIGSHFPEVRLLSNTENCGFAQANNRAVEMARGRYLLLLNPDTMVLPGVLSRFVKYSDEHPEVGIVGPRLLNGNNTWQRSCWPAFPGLGMALSDAFYLWKFKWLPDWLRNEYADRMLVRELLVTHILGACMFIRRETWKKVGPMDEGYFLYFEETDYCYRVRQNGWEIVFNPSAEVIHYGQKSSKQIPEQSLKHYYASMYRFCKIDRLYPPYKLLLLKTIMQIAVIIRLGLWLWRERRASVAVNKELSQRMRSGYSGTLKKIHSFV